MVRTFYEQILEELIEESQSRIELSGDDKSWEETVREVVEEEVFQRFTISNCTSVLIKSSPHDEWNIYCDDMTDYAMVLKAMAYVALRDDVVEKLRNDYDFN